MTGANSTPEPSETQPLQERGIPSVAGTSNLHLVLGGVFASLCAAAIVGIVSAGGGGGDASVPLTQADDEAFRPSPNFAGEPYIVPQPVSSKLSDGEVPDVIGEGFPEPPIEASPSNLPASTTDLDSDRLRARMVSAQLVFDQGRGQARQLTEQSDDLLIDKSEHRNSARTGGASAYRILDISSTVPEGTLITAVLESAISTDLPGEVRAIVSEPVYSLDQSNILIPAGSRLIGKYAADIEQGQARIYVIWNRMIRGDGVSILLASNATDPLGRAGIGAFVDTHFRDRFGGAILLSIIDGAIESAVNSAEDRDANVSIGREGSLQSAASIALEHSISIEPTLHLHQGAAMKVFVAQDLDFSSLAGDAP